MTMTRRSALRTGLAGSLALGWIASGRGALADDSNDDRSSGDRFTAFIYAGTVDALDTATVVTEIDDLEMEDHERENDDRNEGNRDRDRKQDQYWSVLGEGQDVPDELYTGDEDLDRDIDLDLLTAKPHLVVVREGDATDAPVIAAGAIEGEITADGTLLIQLDEVDGSGYEGRAWFGPDREEDDDDDKQDDDQDELEVVVGVFPTGSVSPLDAGTPRG